MLILSAINVANIDRWRTTGRRFKVLLAWDAEARLWVTHVPTLRQLSTYGESPDDALEQTRGAIVGYLEAGMKKVSAFRRPTPRPESSTSKLSLPDSTPTD